MKHQEDCFHLGVKALIQNKEGQVLLLQKNRPQKILWDLPGGRIQKNESAEEALQREVYEETGLQNLAQMIPWTMVLSKVRIPVAGGDVGLILKVYLCDMPDDNSPIQLSDEHVQYTWVEPDKAAELLTANHPAEPAELIQKIHQLQPHPTKKVRDALPSI